MNTHGGARKGAGRPKGSGKGRTVKTSSISMKPAVWDKIDQLKGQQSRSGFISDIINRLDIEDANCRTVTSTS